MKKLIFFFTALLLLYPMNVGESATWRFWRYRTHATDCTSITDGRARDLCFEEDANNLYKCVPDEGSSGTCNAASEWKQAGGGTEVDTLDTVSDRGATTDQTLTAGGFTTTGTGTLGDLAIDNLTIDADEILAGRGASGILTLGGVGGQNNENLTLNFEALANKVRVRSGTGVDTINLDSLGLSVDGNTVIKAGNELQFWDIGNSNYVGFEAPALTANQIWILPSADGSANEFLQTDGAGNLVFAAVTTEWSDETTYLKPTDGDKYVSVGAIGTVNYADGDGDLYVPDELEVDNDIHVLDDLFVYDEFFMMTDDKCFTVGASQDFSLRWNTPGNDYACWTAGVNSANQSGNIIISSYLGDFGQPVVADVHLRIQSSSGTLPSSEFIQFWHDRTDGNIEVGVGDLNLDAAGGDVVLLDPIANIICEGATADDFETTIAITDPTADRTITIPDEDQTIGTPNISDKFVTATAFTDEGINAAIDELGAEGGEVYLPEGTYTVDAQIDIDVNNTTITGSGWGTIIDASTSTDIVFDLNANDQCIIRNLKIVGGAGGGNTQHLIHDNGAAVDLKVYGCWLTSSDSEGIWLDNTGSDYAVIYNNIVESCDGDGMDIDSNFNRIESNEVNNNGAYGINCSSYNFIKNNYVHNNGTIGVYGAASCEINDNFIDGNGQQGVYAGGANIIVDGNHLWRNTRDGVVAYQAHYIKVTNNDVYQNGNGYFGIQINASTYFVVSGNTCVGAAGKEESGIRLVNSDYGAITGNTLLLHDTDGISIDSNSTNNHIAWNNLEGEAVATITDGGSSNTIINSIAGVTYQFPDSDTIADTGDGNPATATLTPTSNYVKLTCNDADTCDITMGETGMVDGMKITIVNTSTNVCDFADTGGVSELAGAFAMGQYDTLELLYETDTWVETHRSDN